MVITALTRLRLTLLLASLFYPLSLAGFFMKLGSESIENVDFSGSEGEFEKSVLSRLDLAGFMKYLG